MADQKMFHEWVEMLMTMIREGKDPEDTCKRVGVMAKWAQVATRLNDIMPHSTVDGVKVVKVILKEDTRRSGNAMLIVTGTRKKDKVVTFHSGLATSDLWNTFWQRAESGTLEWKIDTPPGQTSAEAVETPLPDMPWS